MLSSLLLDSSFSAGVMRDGPAAVMGDEPGVLLATSCCNSAAGSFSASFWRSEKGNIMDEDVVIFPGEV